MDRWRASRPIGALAVALLCASVLVGGALVLAVPLGQRLVAHGVTAKLPNPSLRALALRSVVYDDAGHEIATLSGPEDRAFAPLDTISSTLQNAVLAAEDRDFYHHGGVDWRGVTRALTKNVDAGAAEQGGSTITQQLVKNTMFTNPQRDLERKVKEAVLAIALERRYSKQQIFEQYLNTVYFGNGAYGVRAAAERYFGHSTKTLGPADSALLAALIANPSGRDPVRHPDEAARWRNHVLDEMAAAGFVSNRAATAARAAPLPTKLHPPKHDVPADPIVDEVKRELLSDSRMGRTYDERYHRVFEGGVRIFTTFDPRLQAIATSAAASGLPASPYTAAMAVIDNTNGAVRAIVPGAGFRRSGFDLATQGARQTGSAFKAITLAAALEAGFSPNDKVNANGHCTFRFDAHAPPWNLENYEGESLGTVTLTEALAKSSNCAFARVALALGPRHIVDMAHRLGITRPLAAVPSITLGTQEVSPLDMATAFSVLAADGVRHPAHFVARVETSDGKVIFANRDKATRVLAPQVARTATSMLTHVLRDGTARQTLGDFARPAAGKTGTNDQSRDIWFVGYTPQLTAAVWIGNPNALVPVVIGGSRQVGGNYPAIIWRTFMTAALAHAPVLAFPAPNEALWPPGGYITESGRDKNPPPAPKPKAPSKPKAPPKAKATPKSKATPPKKRAPAPPHKRPRRHH
jgi:membrane peptidoglycan carboxypeptidase